MVAICPNNNEIHIYDTFTWVRLYTLSEHDLLVTAIDWSGVTNKIVTSSHDRNAFVWTFDQNANSWKPALVILRIDRAATDVKWSLDGLRFAVASSAKSVPVCTYEPVNDWWVCKMIKKKFRSTVLCVSFHPLNGQLLATGCADFKCRVFSAFASEVDGNLVNPGPFAVALGGPGPLEFGEMYCELSAMGWVAAVAWSPTGDSLAYAGHDSSIHVATFVPNSSSPVLRTLRLRHLPANSLLFLAEGVLACGGHDFVPLIFQQEQSSGEWSYLMDLDKQASLTSLGLTPAHPTARPPPPPPPPGAGPRQLTRALTTPGPSLTSGARELFRNKTERGQDLATDSLKSVHERPITCMSICSSAGEVVTKIATSALDGKLIVWDLPELELDLAALKL